MADVPQFHMRPPLRCFARLENSPGTICAAAAAWERPASSASPGGFFCDAHRGPGDTNIPDAALFRRVGITLEVWFAGVSFTAGLAQAEALSRVERAIEDVGGLVNLVACRSEVGRLRPAPPPQDDNGTPPGGRPH